MKLYKIFVLREWAVLLPNFFLTDWRHKRLKNTIDLLLFYGEHFYGFLESEILASDFNNFMCINTLHIVILKFLQIPWPDVHMDNLEEWFHHVFNTRLLKKGE